MASRINKDTAVSLGIIVMLLAWAVSYGVMVNKVDDTRAQIVEVKASVTALSDKFDAYILGAKSLSAKP